MVFYLLFQKYLQWLKKIILSFQEYFEQEHNKWRLLKSLTMSCISSVKSSERNVLFFKSYLVILCRVFFCRFFSRFRRLCAPISPASFRRFPRKSFRRVFFFLDFFKIQISYLLRKNFLPRDWIRCSASGLSEDGCWWWADWDVCWVCWATGCCIDASGCCGEFIFCYKCYDVFDFAGKFKNLLK